MSKILQEITHAATVVAQRSAPLRDSAKAYIDALLPTKSSMNLIVMLDGFEDAYIGTAERLDIGIVAVYNRKKCIELLMEQEGISYADSRELFDYNIGSAWLGEKGPIFLTIEGE
jgi:hypothetical protein